MEEPPPSDGPAAPPGASPEPSRPPPPPRPVRGAPPSRPSGGRGSERDRRPAPTPPPARQTVEGTPRDPLRPVELPSRTIERSGEGWVVREGGRTSAGIGRDTRAPLLQLIFALGTEPERPLKEVLTAGRGIADLTDDELLDLLGRARPYQERHDRQEVFPDTRKKGGKGM